MTLLAIDGPAGAGKTTFAAKLQADLALKSSVTVIHMDDLYDGWDKALSHGLTQTLERITSAHLDGQEFAFRVFNWHAMSFDREEKVQPTDFLIIEGVGAAQLAVRKAGARTYWLDVEPEIGLQRVLARDGEHMELEMRQWQVNQDQHFASDKTRENCDFILTS